MRTTAGGRLVGAALVCALAGTARGYYLDKGRNFDVRMRAYSQLSVLTEDSENDGCPDPRRCPPKYSAGDLAQHRNFYNPEFDAKLTDYMTWMGNVGLDWLEPDDMKFRFAWWGFYDGVYDYMDDEWNDRRRAQKARYSQSTNPNNDSFVFDDQNKRARRIYASRNRINELYLDYSKGRFFFRVGRQAISWGEADTIALLDVSNPFDLTLGAPGIFQDIDEARIPLWTLRSTVKLVDSWKWLSSLFLDAYMVPGVIDTTVPINPIAAGVSPFNPDQSDPQLNIIYGPGQKPGTPPGQRDLIQTVIVDRLPDNTWSNTRWGARLTGVLARDYTVQAWYFRTFNQQPVPVLSSKGAFDLGTGTITIDGRRRKTPNASKGVITLTDNRGFRVSGCFDASGARIPRAFGSAGRTRAGRPCSWKAPTVTILERDLNDVIGIAGTWYSQPLNGIIRAEAEYFVDELAFIPERNLNARTQVPLALRAKGERNIVNTAATADYVRWVIGYDRFFFMRFLNPSNSFLLSVAYNNFFNLSEKGGKDYRNPLAKPGRLQAEAGPIPGNPGCQGKASRQNPLCVRTTPRDFEDAYQYEGFVQWVLQTDYMHGKLSPRLVVITDLSGIFTFIPSLTYRVTDNLLLSGQYITISSASRKAGPATFRMHDMLQLRMTLQLN